MNISNFSDHSWTFYHHAFELDLLIFCGEFTCRLREGSVSISVIIDIFFLKAEI